MIRSLTIIELASVMRNTFVFLSDEIKALYTKAIILKGRNMPQNLPYVDIKSIMNVCLAGSIK